MPPVVAAITAVGAAISSVGTMVGVATAALASSIGVTGTVLATISSVVGTIATAGIYSGLMAGVSAIAMSSPTATLPDMGRLNLTQVASEPRKFVAGTTAMAADLRYTEPSGAGQRFVDAVIHLGSHKCTALDGIYINDELAWTPGGGVQGIYAGYMSVWPIMEAGPAAYYTINGGAKWGSAQRMTGCATVRIRIDRRGATDSETSPFVNGLPTNIRFVGRGIPVYDPRRDSTVPGGSGPHRVGDQSTWQFTDGAANLGDNIALQALAWLLGWRVMGQVSCGLGLPVSRLDLPAFAAAANACDEAVALAAGGTQRRYEGGGLFADNADRRAVMAAFAAACNGWWDDSSGKLGLYVSLNDLAGPLATFSDDDVLGAYGWEPFPENETFNVVRGVNPDPQPTALYQPTDYPEVRLASIGAIDRVLTVDLAMVQEKRRAQRIAKQCLQRKQYRGLLTVTIGLRGWQLRRGQPVRWNSSVMGWGNKLFRVEDWQCNLDGSCNLLVREEHVNIYQWDHEEVASVVPAEPVFYDPRNAPGAQGGDEGVSNATVTLYKRGATAPAMPTGTFTFTFATGVLSGGSLDGWTQAFPSDDGNPAWRIDAVASAAAATDTIAAGEFSSPVKAVQSGVAGTRTAVLDVYQWAATAPASFPSGTSTYTWATGQFTAPATLSGWSLTPPAAVVGQTLWRARQVYADNGTSATSAVTWSASAAYAVGGAGVGANGQRVGVLELYRWSAAAPTTYPAGTSTYTWATGAFTLPGTPNGWSLLPGAAMKGQTLWGISVVVSDNLTTATSVATWSSSTVYPVSYAGADGPAGQSTATIYTRATSKPSTPAASAGTPSGFYSDPDSVPAGAGVIWALTGTRAAGATDYVWGGAVRWEAVTGVAAVQSVAVAISTSAWITFTLAPGEGRSIEAQLRGYASGSGTIDLALEGGVDGGSIVVIGSSDGPATGYAEDLQVNAGGTLYNSDTYGQTYRVRATGTKTGTFAVTAAASYLRA